MFRELLQLMAGNKDFGDKSGIYLHCCCTPKEIKLGDLNSMEKYMAPGSKLREMGCYSCAKMGAGCWGPQLAEVRR